ncbi:hypothetical protein FRACYDRAFT_246289 [Fragilariopsis cylindrus CCMP1102]|jgi:uncharacterized membrane protein YqiK|uniref:Uncharacterized protein n=1 Tax=Fragilariopsis cylindrus CCMP1102 TaxID=635003 RepID=A0A1E7EZ82_9STRA|nr:hypothetical protein FRACYDRAFT_246289 [Fragilariopsis cylindrus CCMP1102]|eukprot:OEU11177.1 hypothetical protein FRACYDRAFT_246289 [Fragilariopsis cylindrus CCMP1102]
MDSTNNNNNNDRVAIGITRGDTFCINCVNICGSCHKEHGFVLNINREACELKRDNYKDDRSILKLNEEEEKNKIPILVTVPVPTPATAAEAEALAEAIAAQARRRHDEEAATAEAAAAAAAEALAEAIAAQARRRHDEEAATAEAAAAAAATAADLDVLIPKFATMQITTSEDLLMEKRMVTTALFEEFIQKPPTSYSKSLKNDRRLERRGVKRYILLYLN